LGVLRASLGSLSEAATGFDAVVSREMIAAMVGRLCAQPVLPADEAAVQGGLAVEGSLLRAPPQMVWTVWQDEHPRST
jgi:hypothetical protein